MKTLKIPAKAWDGFKGYIADPAICPHDYLSAPSMNCVIDDTGVASARLGFERRWDVTSSSAIRGFYMQRYNLTFYTAGTSVKYIDHDRSDTIVTVTGITLTAGTTTRFAEYASDVYLINQTDGVYRIVVSAIATANSAGASLVCDSDIGPRLSNFGLGAGNVVVNGTTEAYTVVTTGATTSLTAVATQAYSVGAIVLRVDQRSSLPKGSIITFWKERMVIAGVKIANASTDQPTATMHYSKFATAGVLENIVDFTYGAGGSTMEMVGKSGTITAIQPTENYLYIFKENESYVVSASAVNTSTGQSIPELRSPIHGCVNEDCVADTGNGEVIFMTKNKRFMRYKFAAYTGAPFPFADEQFDVPYRTLLRYLDADQTGAHVFYHKAKRRSYFTCKIDGQWFRLMEDNNINAWQPPQTGVNMNQYLEINGVAYGLSRSDGKVFQMESTNNDNGSPIMCYIATGVFDVGLANIDDIYVKGSISQPTTIHLNTPVNGGTAYDKQILGTTYSYGTGTPYGAFKYGDSIIGGDTSTVDVAEYEKNFDVYPSEANKVQLIMYCFCNSGFFSLRQYLFSGSTENILTPSLS